MDKNMLLFALNVIKNECNRHENSCDGCPFNTNVGYSNCGINNGIPSEWDLLGGEPCKEQLIF